jgi:O-Antigen ligase
MQLPWLRALGRADSWVAATLACVVFLVAYDRGGYALATRGPVAIVACWALLLAVALGLRPACRIPVAARIVIGLLGAFAAWTGASVAWANSAEHAVTEFNRATLYFAIFLLAVIGATRAAARRWADGLALAIAATLVVALVSRCFPSSFSQQGVPAFLPAAAARLSFPIGYWNGLGIFVAFGYPLWLALALRARRWWTRVVAMTPFPAAAAVLFLTSSRGGVLAALVGTIVFCSLTTRRWQAVAACLAAAAGSVIAILSLVTRHELVDGPLNTHAAASEGHQALLLIVAGSVVAGGLYAVAHRLGRPLRSVAVGRAVAVAAAAALVALGLLSHPVRRFEEFKEVPTNARPSEVGFVRSHLVSGSGSGRWQFWSAAVREWKSAPLIGRGAGSYEAWWAEHGSFSYFVRNAHSLYLETLGELGVVGFLLLVGALGYGTASGGASTLRRADGDRIVAASLLGVIAAFIVSAAVDWVWQLTVVSGVGLASLALLLGSAGVADDVSNARVEERRPLRRVATGVAAVALCGAVICIQALPWLADLQLGASRAAIRRGDDETALRRAIEAKTLAPWAASPYLQLALIEESRDLATAEKWIGEALDRDSVDWRLWLVRARIETRAGELARARQSLLRAAALNPRSPLFAGVGT